MPRNAIIKTAETPPWAAGLTLREQKFVAEYVVDLNGRAAAVRAGLGKSVKSATEMASRLRKKATVAAAISALMAERSGATSVSVIDEISRIAFAKMTDFVRVADGKLIVTDTEKLSDEQKAAIAEISETIGENGRTIKIKLHPKLDALEKLMKALGAYKERAEVAHTYVETKEDVMDRIHERLNQLKRKNDAWDAANKVEIELPLPRITPPPAEKAALIIDAE